MTTSTSTQGPLHTVRIAIDLARRTVFSRYRDTVLGVGWSVALPLALLGIYAFVFSQVFEVRWEVESGDQVSFAVVLFSGLLLYNFFAEILNGCTGVILSNAQLIKRTSVRSIVLPLSTVVGAAITFVMSLVPFLIAYFFVVGIPSATAALFPLVVAPLVILSAGLGLLVASVSVFVRDLQHLVFLFTTLVLFTSPIFYPETAIPEQFRSYISVSPLWIPLAESKRVLFFDQPPDWSSLGLYAIVAVALLALSIPVFNRAQGGFADVL